MLTQPVKDCQAGIPCPKGFLRVFCALRSHLSSSRLRKNSSAALRDWLPRWRARLTAAAAEQLRAKNPAVIPRNHLVEAALQAATAGDMAPFQALLAEVANPFAPERGREAHALPPPKGFGRYVTFCGT